MAKVSNFNTKNQQFLYLSDKLDILDERLDSIDKVLIIQESNLKEHMKRTALLEEQISPLNKFMYAAMGIMSFVSFIGIVVAIYVGLK